MNDADPHAATPVLRARGLRIARRGGVVLDGVDLDLGAGEQLVVQGGSGRGTTLLIDLIHGSVRADGGELAVFGLDPVKRSREVLRRVGCVPARPGVWPWLRPRDLFAFLAPHYPAWDEDLVEDLGAEWEVPDQRLGSMAAEQVDRVLWIAALAYRPALLLLEASSASGVLRGAASVLERALELTQEHRGSVLCTTRGPVPEALRSARRLRLDGGRLVGAVPEVTTGAE